MALVGPNGSGKSTLLRVLLGRLDPDRRVRCGCSAPRPTACASAGGWATFRSGPCWPRRSPPRWRRSWRRAGCRAADGGARCAGRIGTRSHHALVSVGLDDLASRPLNELSGGQQQRAFIARAFASEPDLLVLDEPIAGVDAESQRRFRDSLVHLVERPSGPACCSSPMSCLPSPRTSTASSCSSGRCYSTAHPLDSPKEGSRSACTERTCRSGSRGSGDGRPAVAVPVRVPIHAACAGGRGRGRGLRAADRDLPRAEADVADRRRHRAHRVRRRGRRAVVGCPDGASLRVWPIWTALAFAVVGALGIEWLRARRKASGDLALALFFYSGIALGVVFVSRANGLNANILTYLFGQPLDGERRRRTDHRRTRGIHHRGGRCPPAPPVRGGDRRGLVARVGTAGGRPQQPAGRAHGVRGRRRR